MQQSDQIGMFHDVPSDLQLARELSATIGREFFDVMVKHLAHALAADCVYVGEFGGPGGERVSTLAACTDGNADRFQYDVPGSATEQIAFDHPVECRADARSRYPSDGVLARLRAQSCAGIPLRDSQGHPFGVLMAVYRQPTANLQVQKRVLEAFAPRAAAELERKHDDDRLRESEQRYHVFVALNEDAMWRVEFREPIPTSLPEEEQLEQIYRRGYIAECNDALARNHGFERSDQLTGRRLDEFAVLANPAVRQTMLQAIRSGYRMSTVELAPLDHAGRRRYLLRTLWGIVENGMLQRMWGTTRDITGLKRAKKALEASEQRMADLLETLQLLTVLLHVDGTVAYCNKQLYRLTGWEPSEVVGRNWFDLMVPPEERSSAKAAFSVSAHQPDMPIHYEGTLLARQGRRLWIAWDSTILGETEGESAAMGMVGRDITGYKALEAQFHQAQKLESIGHLAGGIAHDFNNLLIVVMGYAEMLVAERDPSDPAYAGLMQIRKAAETGADLTRRLLAFTRRQAWRPELLNLSAVVADDERMFRRLIGEDVTLVTSLDPSLALVRADSGQIDQILLNLVVNARDAMPKGGTLTISAANEELSPQDAAAAGIAPGKYVQLTVADTGTGMTEEVRNQIFEPFYTTKQEGQGTGLGLATVCGIVRECGGQIGVETELGKGTAFRIRFPAVAPEVAPPGHPGAIRAMPRGSETVLLVEDNEDVLDVSATVLRRLGYDVIEASSPVKAEEAARVRNGKIDLLLTDVVMPVSSGTELAAKLKASCPGMRVLLMSGYGELPAVRQTLADPEIGYLQKPYAPADLAAKVRETLDRK